MALSGLQVLAPIPAWATPSDLDPSFGNEFGWSTILGPHEIVGMVRQSDGKLVVVGTREYNDTVDWAIGRLNANGSLDTTFSNGDGDEVDGIKFLVYDNDTIGALAIQADGKILAGGDTWGAGSMDFAAARYTATGALDTSYGTDGKAVHPVNNSTTDGAHAMALDSDGKALLIGSSTFAGGELAGIRLTTTGALDTTFHGDGIIADHTANITNSTLTCHLGTINPGANATVTVTTTPTTTGEITSTATVTATQPDPNTTNNTTQTTTQINP